MNLGNQPTKAKYNSLNLKKQKQFHRFGVFIFKFILVFSFILLIIGGFTCIGMFRGILDSAPDISAIDITPSGTSSVIYDSDGNAVQTLVMDYSDHQEVSYDEIPQHLINSILVTQDPGFFYHNGIDLKALLSTLTLDITAGTIQSPSQTITQKLVKNGLFNTVSIHTGLEKMEAFLQERYLALQLENKMDKKTILTNYLNTINLGNNTLGIQAASECYFSKNVSDLTLSECTVIAALAENPSLYNPIKHKSQNEEQRKSILDSLLENTLITQAQYSSAIADDVYSRIQSLGQTGSNSGINNFSYYTEEVFNSVLSDLQEKLGCTETQAYYLLYNGGLSIYTAMDSDAQAIADEEVNNAENYPTSEFSLDYLLTVSNGNGTSASYTEADLINYEKNTLQKPAYKNIFTSEDVMISSITEFKAGTLKQGDTIIKENISTIPQPQSSVVIMEQSTGYVLALCGGRGEESANITYNRATDAMRQPGSSFQTLTSFAPALDVAGSTLATTYYDAPYSVNGKAFANWWNEQYMGYANIRQGIKYSMNILSAKCLVQTVSPAIGYDYATNLGITTLTTQDKSASLATGMISKGVTNIDLTSAYAAIANNGTYHEPILYTKVIDSDGKTLLENESQSRTVLKASTASLLTDAMADSVEGKNDWNDYGINPTGSLCKVDGVSIAGSAGFTPDSKDLWFVGYSPYITCGIWSGYDDSQILESSDYHKLIWEKIMSRVHTSLPNASFEPAGELEEVKICSKSGLLAIDNVCNHEDSNSIVYSELFEHGTAPTQYCDLHVKVNICMDSDCQAGPNCPKERIRETVYWTLDSLDTNNAVTADTPFRLPKGLLKSICTIHQ